MPPDEEPRERRSLVLTPGSIENLGDIVKIARVEGRKLLDVEKVCVLPYLNRDPDGNYIVIVEPESRSAGVAEEGSEDRAQDVQARGVAGLDGSEGDT